MPGGGGVTPSANALVLPKLEAMPHRVSTAFVSYTVQGRPGALRDRNDVEVVEEGQ